jgi:drug/metabolite transporter (DMT)-like permease
MIGSDLVPPPFARPPDTSSRTGGARESAAMPSTALGLVLLAALLHASWNFAAKRAGGDLRLTLVAGGFNCVLWAPLGLWAAWGELAHWSAAHWLVLAASATTHVVYFAALLTGYRHGDLTVVYPLARGSGPLLTAVAAVLLLGERLSPVGVLGVLGVCGGVFLIAGGPALWRGAHDPGAPARLRAGLRWGIATGATIACYSVIDGYAIKKLQMAPLAFDYFCNLLRLPLLLPLALRDPAGMRSATRALWKPALVIGLLSPAAYVLVLYAVRLAPLAHVAPAREVSMLVAALLGGRLLCEGERALRVAGAGCIALGVVALSLA